MSGIGIALAAVGAAVAIGTAAASGAEANKSKKAARQAEKVAQRKMEEAKKELQRMPMQELSLDLQGYKSEQEASQVAAAMGIDAEQQSSRLGATIGRIQMSDIEQQRAARLDKVSDLEKLQLLKATERQEASDKLYELGLSEAEGAQQAAADSDQMAAAYTSQAIQSGMQAVQGVANVAGAAVAPQMEASAAFDKNLASVPEADLKSYLMSNKATSDALGGASGINALDAAGLKNAYVKYFNKDVSKWSDPAYLSQIYTPTSKIN